MQNPELTNAASGWLACPECGSTNLRATPLEGPDGERFVRVWCRDCDEQGFFEIPEFPEDAVLEDWPAETVGTLQHEWREYLSATVVVAEERHDDRSQTTSHPCAERQSHDDYEGLLEPNKNDQLLHREPDRPHQREVGFAISKRHVCMNEEAHAAEEASGDTPAEASAEQPAEAPAEEPAEAPVEEPAEAPTDTGESKEEK